MNRPALVLAAAVTVASLTSCSSSSDDAVASASSSAGAEPVSQTTAGDVDATCSAVVDLDGEFVGYPGADPDAPAPSSADLQAFEAQVRPTYEQLTASAPAELSPTLDVLGGLLDGLAEGTPIDESDPSSAAASAMLDQWAHDSCEYPALDVTNDGTTLSGVPATLPAGPVSVSFTNASPPDLAGFALLVAQVADGAEVTPAQVADGSVDVESVITSIIVASPTEQSPVAYTLGTLEPGRYLVVSPLGAPPQFGATLATEFTVS